VEYLLELIVLPVADVDRAREFYRRIGFLDYVGGPGFLMGRGVPVSEVFHDPGGVLFHHADEGERAPGLYPGRLSYGSFASFTDPDGNGFLLQEVTERHPGR
jgi:catechol 2,3-dioxygenase-like lactoylglutathione lyase family enzyme